MKRSLLCSLALSLVFATSGFGQEDDAAADKPASTVIDQMIKDGELAPARKKLEEAIAANEDDSKLQSLRRTLGLQFAQKGDFKSAAEQNEKLLDFQLQKLDDEAVVRQIGSTTMMLNSMMMRADRKDEMIGIYDRVIAALEAKEDGFSPVTEAIAQLIQGKAGLLRNNEDMEGVKTLINQSVEKALALLATKPDDKDIAAFAISTLTGRMTLVSDGAADDLSKIESIAVPILSENPADDKVLLSCLSAMITSASINARSDTDVAEATSAKARGLIDAALEADVKMENVIKSMQQRLVSVERTIKSTKRLAELVGKPAPAIDAEYWVNGEQIALDDLKGKVVLLDFWAIWCGPCIATFPHLREWNEEFASEGLQIIGVTRKYDYSWNDEAGRASKRTDEVENTPDEEKAMLEKFMAHHELKHPTIITPAESTMNTEFGVSGIPHAVVIDRDGIIRMIKVGSGDENANAIHELLKKLVAEKAH